MSVVLLKLLFTNEGLLAVKITCSLMFLIQSGLIIIKNIYLGSVTAELAQYFFH